MKELFSGWFHPPEKFNFTMDVIEREAAERPDALALWWVDEFEKKDSKKYTFAQLSKRVQGACHFFKKQGIQKGDRILIILPRIPEWWISLLALMKMGAVPMPGTSLLTTKDIQLRMDASEARGMITDPAGAEKSRDIPMVIRIIADGEFSGWVPFQADENESVFRVDSTLGTDPGMIFFTSGTTGQPKMVLHTQASLGLGHRVTGELWLDLNKEDVFWNLSDTGWAKAAWSSFFGPWHRGSCVFTVDTRGKFDPRMILNFLQKYPITAWCAAPTALRLMIREDLSQWKFPSLRHCVSAGEPLNPEVMEVWKKATGLDIYEGYGQTETVVLAGNFRSWKDPIRPGSMGKANPGFDLAVLDLNSMKEQPAGQEGELAIRVDPIRPLGLFMEYWKNEEENERRFRNGWYLTGDIVKKDEEGYFWFVGRADDVIKSSGYRIGPFEVESVLVEHPAVLESAVVAKPDEMRGCIVKAYVVLRKGFEPHEKLKEELQEHCKQATAPYKYPREIEFLPELPKTVSGKIRRVELRKKAEQEV